MCTYVEDVKYIWLRDLAGRVLLSQREYGSTGVVYSCRTTLQSLRKNNFPCANIRFICNVRLRACCVCDRPRCTVANIPRTLRPNTYTVDAHHRAQALWGVPRIICFRRIAAGHFQCMFIANIYRFIALENNFRLRLDININIAQVF